MDTLKLLIAESSEDFRIALAESLRGAFCVRECADGVEALRILRTFQPDVLVLDLMLPGKDGISLLQEAVAGGLRPMVLATTRFASDYVLDVAGQLGVGYVMIKPCDVRATVARIGDLSRRLNVPRATCPDPRIHVSNMLLTLGVPTKLNGYGYLREAIPLMAKDRGQAITKELYPAVAKLYRCEPKNVERSIRSAIDSAWKKRDERIWRMYFPPDTSGIIQRPTNAAFISRLADCRELENEDAYI